MIEPNVIWNALDRLQKENAALRQMVLEEIIECPASCSPDGATGWFYGSDLTNIRKDLFHKRAQLYDTAEECLAAELQKRMGE